MPAPSWRLNPLALQPSGMPRPGGLSGWVTAQANLQSHLRPGETSQPRRQKWNWLPLHLSDCPTCQHSGAQRHIGSLLSHFVGAGYHVPPIHLITRGICRRATVCPSSSSCASTQAVPKAQQVASFPRPHGQHASGQDHIQSNLGRAPQLQMARGPTLKQGTQAEPLRSIQLGHCLGEGGWEGIFLKAFTTTSLQRAPAISQRYLSGWPRALTY